MVGEFRADDRVGSRPQGGYRGGGPRRRRQLTLRVDRLTFDCPGNVDHLGGQRLKRRAAGPLPGADHGGRDGHERQRSAQAHGERRAGHRCRQSGPHHDLAPGMAVGQHSAEGHRDEESGGTRGQHDAEPRACQATIEHGEPKDERQRPGRQSGGGGCRPQSQEGRFPKHRSSRRLR